MNATDRGPARPGWVVDTHQHFWAGRVPAYDTWMTGALAGLDAPHTPRELAVELAPAGVDATVAVQTWSSPVETRQYLRIAADTDFVVGVVGWLDLTASTFAADLDRLLASDDGSWLVGLRHTVDLDETPAWFGRPSVREAFRVLGERDLCFDVLIGPEYLPAATDAARALPETRFVLDHCAKPPLRDGSLVGWERDIRALAALPNVWCKLSGLVTLAPTTWTATDFHVASDVVLDAFGADRLMFGSDWPVCTAARSYADVRSIAAAAVAGCSDDEQTAFFGGNAVRCYRLGRP